MAQSKDFKELLLDAHYMMYFIRKFEEKTGQLYGMGEIGGFCHLCIGQEAVCVGICAAIKDGDATITSYRDHGIMLAAGSDPVAVLAELLGREAGCSKGKGGSMHMFDNEKRFYGGHGIVGAQVPLGTGIAFSFKYRKQDNICVTLFGDGAANQGQVYESFNMAKLWGLPVLYLIENNEYSMGTSVERGCATEELYKRGLSFDIKGVQVDGMSFIDVYEAMLDVSEYVRSKKEPMIIEAKTYRYRGHSVSDPATYRTKEEVQEYKDKRDPIANVVSLMKKNKISEAKIKANETKAKAELKKIVEASLSSPLPDTSELLTEICSGEQP